MLKMLKMVWGAYQASFDLRREIHESRPGVVAVVVAAIAAGSLALALGGVRGACAPWVPGVLAAAAGAVSCLAWGVHRDRPTVAGALQLVDVPLYGAAVLALGWGASELVTLAFLLFFCAMAQKYARQFALNPLSAVTTLAPSLAFLESGPVAATIVFGNAVFYVHTAWRTRGYHLHEAQLRRHREVVGLLGDVAGGNAACGQLWGVLHSLKSQMFTLEANLLVARKVVFGPSHEELLDVLRESELIARGMQGALAAVTQAARSVGSVFRVGELVEALRWLGGGDRYAVRCCTNEDVIVHGGAGMAAVAVGNLVTNAVEAGAGVVEVQVDVRSEGVLVRVCDDGPGLPAEVRDRLWQAGVTVGKPSGSGLGLYLTAAIVAGMRGRVELVETGPGGTVWDVWLAVAR